MSILCSESLRWKVKVKLAFFDGDTRKEETLAVYYRSITDAIEKQFSSGGKDGEALPVPEQLALVVTNIEGLDATTDAEFFRKMHVGYRNAILNAITDDVYPNANR